VPIQKTGRYNSTEAFIIRICDNLKMKSKRSSIPKVAETEVLVRSRRRCCLCFFIDADISVKKIQIAHLDKNPYNNKLHNLVALCLDHHDEFDSISSQSKGITINEVKHYRDKLYKIIEDRDNQSLLEVFDGQKYNSARNQAEYPAKSDINLREKERIQRWEGFLVRIREAPLTDPYAIGVVDIKGFVNLPNISELFGIPYHEAIDGLMIFVQKVLDRVVSVHSKVISLGLCNDNIILVSSYADHLLHCLIDLIDTANKKVESMDRGLLRIGILQAGIAWTHNSKGESYKTIRSGLLALKIADIPGRTPGTICVTETVYGYLTVKYQNEFLPTDQETEQGKIYIKSTQTGDR